MKKRIVFILAFMLSISFISNGQILKQIFEAFAEEQKKSEAVKSTPKDLVSQTFVVNSASKARLSGGKTREAIKINLPAGTKRWYYRVTVLSVTSTYTYQDNETFFYLLNNKKYMETYKPTDEAIDFYVLGHSGDVASFLETGNNNFKVFSDYTKIGTNSFIGSATLNQENLWIGIKNPNAMTGLKVIVEVVAWGTFN